MDGLAIKYPERSIRRVVPTSHAAGLKFLFVIAVNFMSNHLSLRNLLAHASLVITYSFAFVLHAMYKAIQMPQGSGR
jgi:hypothetical protein